MKIHFFGGAKVVTGANYLLTVGKSKILVDCGLFQGTPEMDELNYQDFPYDPKIIDYVFITHSHLDHCGRLARLTKLGFKGKIICTAPTRDIMEVALADSVRLMEDDAKAKGHQPLFNEQDLANTFKLVEVFAYEKKIKLNENVSFNLRDSGHILGSSIIELWLKEGKKNVKIAFTGDLGNPPTPILKDPVPITETDYLVIESAYGDRIHENRKERKQLLQDVIMEAVNNKAVLLIPSFAIERTQELLSELNDLVEHHKIPTIPIFIDSPLAIKITEVYKRYTDYFNLQTRQVIKSGDDIFKFPGLKFTTTRDESMAIIHVPAPKIIIAGSGMSTGGRILFHEKVYLSNPHNYFLVIGFQVAGTLGRKIYDGLPVVDILGDHIRNKVHIRAIGGYSAHADQNQLVRFISKIKKPAKQIFIVQGEQEAAESLKKVIAKKLKQNAIVPKFEQEFEL